MFRDGSQALACRALPACVDLRRGSSQGAVPSPQSVRAPQTQGGSSAPVGS